MQWRFWGVLLMMNCLFPNGSLPHLPNCSLRCVPHLLLASCVTCSPCPLLWWTSCRYTLETIWLHPSKEHSFSPEPSTYLSPPTPRLCSNALSAQSIQPDPEHVSQLENLSFSLVHISRVKSGVNLTAAVCRHFWWFLCSSYHPRLGCTNKTER